MTKIEEIVDLLAKAARKAEELGGDILALHISKALQAALNRSFGIDLPAGHH